MNPSPTQARTANCASLLPGTEGCQYTSRGSSSLAKHSWDISMATPNVVGKRSSHHGLLPPLPCSCVAGSCLRICMCSWSYQLGCLIESQTWRRSVWAWNKGYTSQGNIKSPAPPDPGLQCQLRLRCPGMEGCPYTSREASSLAKHSVEHQHGNASRCQVLELWPPLLLSRRGACLRAAPSTCRIDCMSSWACQLGCPHRKQKGG